MVASFVQYFFCNQNHDSQTQKNTNLQFQKIIIFLEFSGLNE